MEAAMPMTANLLVALCEQNAHSIREELKLIEAGDLKVQLRGDDITATENLRLRANLGRLLQIIEAWGCQPD